MTDQRSPKIEDLNGGPTHQPCPACGVLVPLPELEDVLQEFVCPSCRGHLSQREGHLHLVWGPVST